MLEHDRWKTELLLDHEFKIEELRNNLLRGSANEAFVYSEEDRNFNSLTSGSECGDPQIFRLAKTKVKNGITTLCINYSPSFYSLVAGDERWGGLPDNDKNRLKIKAFFTMMVYFVCCAERVRRWPTAKDKSSFSQVQKELESKCMSFSSRSIELVYEKLVLFWPTIFNHELEFNDQEIKPIILDCISKNQEPLPKNIKESPVFKATAISLPGLDLEILEKYYSIMPYIEAGVKTLTLDFINNRPPELDYTDEYAEWSDIYINHLHSYKENWRKVLKEIWTRTEDEQKLWDKELT